MFEIFKPAKFIERLPEEKIDSTYKRYRVSVFISIFIGYAGYYLIRKNFAIATPYLMKHYGFNTAQIGLIGTVLAISYGLSKFIMGNLSDKCNPRYYIAAGLVGSAVINLFFASTSSIWIMMILMVFIGMFQGMGAPPCHKILATWFSLEERGTKMSAWNASHNLGAGSIAPLVGLGFLAFGQTHWQTVFYFPSIVAIILAAVVIGFGADTPQSVGLPPIEEYRNKSYKTTSIEDTEEVPIKAKRKELSAKEIMVKYVLKNKYMWYIAFANVFVYLIRYGIQDWIPVYLTTAKGFTNSQSRITFSLFEYAAIPGVILIGWISDKLFKGKRAPMGIVCMLAIIGVIFVYWKSTNVMIINISIALMGILVYGPQMLLSVSTIDLVPKCAVGTSAGFIGLFGYIGGEVTANLVIGTIAHKVGWNSCFYIIIASSIFAIVFFTMIMNPVKMEEDHIEETVDIA